MRYKYIFIIYATLIGFFTGYFNSVPAQMHGLKTPYSLILEVIIFIWIILIISALLGLIVVYIGKILIKLNIMSLKIKQIIDSSELPMCIGSIILGIFTGIVYFNGDIVGLIIYGYGIIPLIFIGTVLIIVGGLKIIINIIASESKKSIIILKSLIIINVSAIILSQIFNLLLTIIMQI